MTLTGRGLIAALMIVTVLLPVLGVAIWRRCRGGRVVVGVQRVIIVLMCQLAALALVAALVNDNNYFYTSWGQLHQALTQQFSGVGQSGQPSQQATGTSTPKVRPSPGVLAPSVPTDMDPASAGRIQVHSVTGTPAQWSRRGRLESVTILGAISGLHEHAFVYFPPQYFQRRYATARFPGVEVMTGYPGNDIGLVRGLRYPDVLERLQRLGRARPMILVMMRPSVTFPRDTECTDVPGGPQALTFFAADVPAQIARSYRVKPVGWGAIGDSTGGYCVTKLAMTHPLIFTASASLSGYYFALRDGTTGDLWGGSPAVRHLNDLRWRMLHLPAPPVSLLIATARTEKGADGYTEALSFARVIRPPTNGTLLVSPTGGHNARTWSGQLPSALTWLSAQIARAR
ncbi:alpha/beta hydrolase [Flexivirga caeni]|uniref:Esterase n=1 Tax=Flexivirga caeni TaxID=2294115 RepID=A0A3M9ME86_9MICO|nr:alpha/beta hydrolase-fold protein [Flexivirga caeni]RNI22928.1 hypothetical protein EFY87_08980 [Flexivirga caeni]